ncbi:hypothetical protein FRB95_009302 [Tulasnella sp. JGI-2019a]|nr:hypothetical protein FRB95_009302 [Tulasnella sp. JGI-2019a]
MYVQLDAQPLPALAARITLAVRPGLGTDINSSTFRVECVPMTSLYPSKATQVLVQVKYISIDAGMRILLDENVPWAHAPAIKIGETMRAETVGLVVQVHPTYCSALEVGDEVLCNAGWVTYGLVEETDVKKIMYVSLPAETPFAAMQYLMERRSQDHDAIHAIDYLGSLGGTGLTAYFGLTDIGKIKHGETCVISGAAGAVGSMACQIAKIQGTKVFGIAGGPAKCKYLEEELGVDKALDYKDPNFVAQFKKHVGRL